MQNHMQGTRYKYSCTCRDHCMNINRTYSLDCDHVKLRLTMKNPTTISELPFMCKWKCSLLLKLQEKNVRNVNIRTYSTKVSPYTLKNETFNNYLQHLEEEFTSLSDGVACGRLTKLDMTRMNILSKTIELYHLVKRKYEELKELSVMETDEEMKQLASEDKSSCLAEIEQLEAALVNSLLPEEPVGDRDIMLEIESGAGGQEAMLFAQQIFEMYRNYAAFKRWQFTPMHIENDTDHGGMRKAVVGLSGHGVFDQMKYESGVHRVQRVPKTEKSGRIHTSTISVAILPQPTEIEINLNEKEIEWQTFRSSGPGGQNAQKVESAVRVKHIPTGITADCQETRSQVKNRKLALAVLCARLYDKQQREVTSKQMVERKMQIGNKDRSIKIRTYNFPQNRITDHRLGQNFYDIDTFMLGGVGLEKMLLELLKEARLENFELIFTDFKNTKDSRISKNARK